MFAFEFEPQISFLDKRLAKKEIYFCLDSCERKEVWLLKNNIDDHTPDIVTINLPFLGFKNFIDSAVSILEVRNTRPFPTIKEALVQINKRTEILALELFGLLKVRFAFILPPTFIGKFGNCEFSLTKHLNIMLESKIGKDLHTFYKGTQSYFYPSSFCDIRTSRNKMCQHRIHLRLPYRFNNYSIKSIIKYIRDAENYCDGNGSEKLCKKYNVNTPEIVGFVDRWGRWKWINKYY